MTENAFGFLEILEERIAPAALVHGALTIQNGTTASYTDVDGDKVTVKFNKKIFDLNGDILDEAFAFTASPGDSTHFSLSALDLSEVAPFLDLKGLSVSITAQKKAGGDGFVNVGAILGGGLDLNSVTVKGSLAKITAGDGDLSTAGLNKLAVDSLGLPNAANPSNLASVSSVITGDLMSLQVKKDINKAFLSVVGSGDVRLVDARIGGSLFGGTLDYTGSIKSAGSIAKITVGGSIFGGTGDFSGGVFATSDIGSVKMDGIFGGGGETSGVIKAGGDIGKAAIDGDIFGGAGQQSGMLFATGAISSATIKGSIYGLSGVGSGKVCAGQIDTILVKGDLVGGSARSSGQIWATDSIEKVTVNGSLFGKAASETARIYAANDIGSVIIKGDLWGGSAANSGSVLANGILSVVTVKGDLHGNSGLQSGAVISVKGGMQVASHGSTQPGSGTRSGGFYSATG